MFATVHSEPAVVGMDGGMHCCGVCNAIYRSDFQRCPTDGGELTLMTADPLVGKTLSEHYVVDALIGAGAMGRVYRAHHVRLVHKRYAIKVMFGDLAVSATMRVRFQREGEAASRLDHPGVVRVVDFGRTRAGLMYLVMELVEGPTLRRLIREAPMISTRVIGLARQLADALAHAHARGVVHRDLKPDNVLVVGDVARIADFGLAISITGEDARMTTSGVMCTPLYAAPEQMLGKEIDHRVDLYALGATMFEMLTGLPPFQGNAHEVMATKLGSPAPKVGLLAHSVPPALASLVDRLLARKPEDRPGCAAEVIASLDQLTETMPPARAWRRAAAGCAAIAAVVVLVAISRRSDVSRASAGPVAIDEVLAPGVRNGTSQSSPTTPRAERAAPTLPRPTRSSVAAPLIVPAFQALAVSPVQAHLAIAAHAPTATVVAAPHAPPHIVDLIIAGSFSPSVVRRAIDRVMPALRHCADRVGERLVVARFAIGETRRANGLQVAGAGSSCLASALASVRTEVVPDLGDVRVQVTVAF